MLEVALGRLLGVVARMEGMTARHVRVVRTLLVRPGLMVLRRFLVMSRGVLVVFRRLRMMFSRLFGHGIPPVSGERPSDRIEKLTHISGSPGSGAIGPWSYALKAWPSPLDANGNLLRRLALPLAIQSWSLTSLEQRLFKTGGRLIRHARYFVLQLAESHLTSRLFGQILGRIERLAWHPT
jgi:hypothetical protein